MSGRRFLSIEAAAIVLVTLTVIAQGTDSLHRGESLFLGKLPLEGKPRGHVDTLPTEVVRCANCHASDKLKLDRTLLLEAHQRRGGPPSTYDQTKFCKLLRTGVDPVYIMIDHTMPTYDMPDADCAALWVFVTRKENTSADH